MKKKAQEEIVGFVLIMVVVAVIFLIFLGLSIRKGPTADKADSEEISQFLDSILEFSVEECSTSYSYLNLEGLIRECYNNPSGSICGPDEQPCEALDRNIKTLIDSSWLINIDSPETGYLLYLYDPEGNAFSFISDPCEDVSRRRGAEKIIPVQSGSITISLELCLKT